MNSSITKIVNKINNEISKGNLDNADLETLADRVLGMIDYSQDSFADPDKSLLLDFPDD
mgnify:CR=1 FL=1